MYLLPVVERPTSDCLAAGPRSGTPAQTSHRLVCNCLYSSHQRWCLVPTTLHTIAQTNKSYLLIYGSLRVLARTVLNMSLGSETDLGLLTRVA